MKRLLKFLTLAAVATAVPIAGIATEPATPDPVRIGMVQTLFTDVPSPIVNLLTPPFKSLMKEFTGLNGAPEPGGDAFEIAKKLMDDKLHLAVFHGIEYAWVAQKYPELKPLMVAVSKYHTLKAYVIVRNEDAPADFTGIKGKEFGLPFRTREHCRLFVEKNCSVCGQCDPKSYFGAVVRTANAESALDDVLSGKLGGTVVDTLAWENYAEVKPGCHRRLKVLKESEPFPAAVIVYREGALSDATLTRFRQGMTAANRSDRGRDLMTLWKLTSFEPVPATYAQAVTEIVKHYPAPVPVTAVSNPGMNP